MKTYLVSIYVALAPPANAEPVKMDWRIMPGLVECRAKAAQEVRRPRTGGDFRAFCIQSKGGTK